MKGICKNKLNLIFSLGKADLILNFYNNVLENMIFYEKNKGYFNMFINLKELMIRK
jgi:hypothetical protein